MRDKEYYLEMAKKIQELFDEDLLSVAERCMILDIVKNEIIVDICMRWITGELMEEQEVVDGSEESN